jgi:pre-rRNA-processing protein TSR3
MMIHNNSKKYNPKIYCLHYNECDPKKCTALKLKKFNLIKIIGKIKEPLNKAIILNPFAQKEISVNDRDIIIKYGLIVIDCSWKNLLKFKDFDLKNSRKLPPLIAVNPINYGKWEKLSSAEAVAAALVIIEFEDFAKLILSKFSWGDEFFKLNYK